MRAEDKERWQELYELAAKEQDPDKLLALTQEINQLLEENEDRLKVARKQPANPSAD
jgi:hypothetical protein